LLIDSLSQSATIQMHQTHDIVFALKIIQILYLVGILD
jgi:hypothetical protein